MKSKTVLMLVIIAVAIGMLSSLAMLGAAGPVSGVQEEWSVPMLAYAAIEGVKSLEFGTRVGASDTYDSGIDVLHVPRPPDAAFDAYFQIVHEFFDQVDGDYRAPADSHQWTLKVRSQSEAIALNWTTASGVPDGMSLLLSHDDVTVDMKEVNGTTLPAGQHEVTITASSECILEVTSSGCCPITVEWDQNSETVPAGGNDIFIVDCGTQVTVAAADFDQCCQFQSWSDGGDKSHTILVDMDKSVTAFCSVLGPYTLDVTSYGCCSIIVGLPGGDESVPSGTSQTLYDIPCGSLIDLDAITDECCQFDSWSGDVADPNSASTTVTMDDDKTVTATCTKLGPYDLTVVSDGCCPITVGLPGGDETVPAGGNDTFVVDCCANVTVTADDSDPCCQFIEWTGDVSGASNPITFHMDGNKTVTALCTYEGWVVRDLPDYAIIDQSFNVTVTFAAPEDDFNAILLTDEADGAYMSVSVDKTWCDPDASFQKATDNKAEYIWADFYNAGTPFTAVYEVTVDPATPEGNYTVSGWLEYFIAAEGPLTIPIAGDSEVEVIEGIPIAGVTAEVDCSILPNATVELYAEGELKDSDVSDDDGNYWVIAPGPGEYDVVVSRSGFKDETQSISIDEYEQYTLDFIGEIGLVPNAPNGSYVVKCVNHWLYPVPPCGLSGSRVVKVVNAWLYPILSESMNRSIAAAPAGEVGVARYLPATVKPGETFDVTVTFNAPEDDFNAILLTDEADGSYMSVSVDKTWCDPDASFQKATDNKAEYIWADFYNASTPFTAVYQVTVDPGTPEGLYLFSGWLEYYIADDGPFTLPIGGDCEVIIEEETYTLDVTSAGCCPIEVGNLPGGNETVPAGGNQTFYNIPCDEVISLHAITGVCCEFDTWTGDVDLDGTTNPNQVTMDGDKSVTATCSALDGTICGYGDWEPDPDNFCQERREILRCSQGECVPSGEYEYRDANEDQICGYGEWEQDPDNFCQERRDILRCSQGECVPSGEYEYQPANEDEICGYGDWEQDPDNFCQERREILRCSQGECVPSGDYEYQPANEGEACDYGPWEDDPANPCQERREIWKCSSGQCTPIGEYEYRDKGPYTLEVTSDGCCPIIVGLPGGDETVPANDSLTFEEIPCGTDVTVTADDSDDCCQFDSWTGDVTDPNSASTTVTIDDDKTVTANCIWLDSDLTVNAPDCCNVDVGAPVSVTVAAGTSQTFTDIDCCTNVSLTAVPTDPDCCVFDDPLWSGDVTGNTNPESIHMDGTDKTVTANCIWLDSDLTVNAPDCCDVDVGAPVSVTVAAGTSQTFTDIDCCTNISLIAVPTDPDCCVFDDPLWSGDVTGNTNPESIHMDGTDKTVTANCIWLDSDLTVNAADCCDVDVGAPVSVTVAAGTSQTFTDIDCCTNISLTAVPTDPDCCVFDDPLWSGDVTGNTNPESIHMDGTDKTVTATCNDVTYDLTVISSGCCPIHVGAPVDDTVAAGTSQTFYDIQCGAQISIDADESDPCCDFDSWSGDVDFAAGTNPNQVTMNGDRVVTATCNDVTYDLTVTSTGCCNIAVGDLGTVTGGQSQTFHDINCCTTVNLFADDSDACCDFDNWSGNVDLSSDTNPNQVTMDGDRVVTATCNDVTYDLTVISSGCCPIHVGAPIDDTVAAGTSQTFYNIQCGAVISLEADESDSCCAFDNWGGNIDFTAGTNPNQVTMYGDRVVTATCETLQYELTVESNGCCTKVEVNGSEYDLPYNDTFECGAQVSLAAVDSACCQFDSWGGDASGTSPTTSVTMNGNKGVVVNCSQLGPYMLEITSNGCCDKVEVNGTQYDLPYSDSFACGAQVNLAAMEETCCQFDSWGGDASGTSPTTSVTMDGNKGVVVNCSVIQYSLDVSSDGCCPITVQWGVNGNSEVVSAGTSDSFTIDCGTDVTVTADDSDDCCQFDSWTGDVTDPNSASTTVTIDEDKTVTATCNDVTYDLTVTSNGCCSEVEVDETPYSLPYSDTFACGAEVSLTAVDSECCQFDSWSGDASGTSPTTSVTTDGNKSVVVNCSQLGPYTLEITSNGCCDKVEVNGTQYELPYSDSFACSAEVSLTAVEDTCCKFDSWGGDASGTFPTTSVTMDGNKGVIVNCSVMQYSLHVSSDGCCPITVQWGVNGNSEVVSAGTSDSFTIECGTDVTVTADDSDPCCQFDAWSGDVDDPNAATNVVTMDDNKNVTATCAEIIVVQMDVGTPSEGSNDNLVFGTDVEASDGYDGGIDVAHTPPGPGATFDAYFEIDDQLFPQLDHDFRAPGDEIQWTLKVWSTTEDISLTWDIVCLPEHVSLQIANTDMGLDMNTHVKQAGSTILPAGEHTLTITAKTVTYTLTVTADPPAGGTASGSGSYYADTYAAIHAYENDCFDFTEWTGDGITDPLDPHTTVLVDGNKTVTAHFTPIVTSTLTMNANPADGGSVTGGGNYPCGDDATVRAIPATCWQFTHWSGDLSGIENPTTVAMTRDKTVIANFARLQYTVSVSANPPEGGTVTGGGIYKCGDSATLQATPTDECWYFTGWSGDLTGSTNPATVTVTGDRTITANFATYRYTLTTTPSPAQQLC